MFIYQMEMFDDSERNIEKVQFGVYIEKSLFDHLQVACKVSHRNKTDFIKMCLEEGIKKIYQDYNVQLEEQDG